MSTLISNLKVNDESLWGYVKPMPPPPALALAHEVWRATRDGDTAAAKDALEKLTALTERRVVPIPIKASSRVEIDDTVEESRSITALARRCLRANGLQSRVYQRRVSRDEGRT